MKIEGKIQVVRLITMFVLHDAGHGRCDFSTEKSGRRVTCSLLMVLFWFTAPFNLIVSVCWSEQLLAKNFSKLLFLLLFVCPFRHIVSRATSRGTSFGCDGKTNNVQHLNFFVRLIMASFVCNAEQNVGS